MVSTCCYLIQMMFVILSASIVPAVYPLDMSEPNDPELQVMQAMFMEERLIKLKVYENMPLIELVPSCAVLSS